MRSLFFIIISTVIIGLANSCRPSHTDAGRLLDRADSLMDTHPDSALTILEAVGTDSLAPEMRARHALLLSQAYDKNLIDTPDASIIDVALDYYLVNPGHRDRLARSCYYRGVVAFNARDYQLSIYYLSLADTLAASLGDNRLRGFANSILAWNSKRLLDFEKELSSAQTALHFFNLDGDSARCMSQMSYIASCYLQLDKSESALEILDDPHCQQNDYIRALTLLKLGRIGEAQGIIDNNPKLAKRPKLMASHACQLILRGDLAAADTLLRLAYRHARNNSDTAACNEVRARYLKSKGQWEQYSALLEESIVDYNRLWSNTLRGSTSQGYTDALKAISELEKSENEARSHRRTIIFIFSIMSIMIGFTIAIIIMRLKHKYRETLHLNTLMLARYECEQSQSTVKHLMTENRALTDKFHAIDNVANRYDADTIEETVLLIKSEIEEIIKRYLSTPSARKADKAEIIDALNSTLTYESLQTLEYYIDSKQNHIITRMRDNGFKESHIKIFLFEQLGYGNNTIAILLGYRSEKTVANNRSDIHKLVKKMIEQV